MTIYKIKYFAFLFNLILLLPLHAESSQGHALSFHFRFGDVIKYQIEQQDSISTVTDNITLEDDVHLLYETTFTVTETPPKNPYQIEVMIDTVDIVHPARLANNLIEKEINQILYKAQVGVFKFKPNGEFIKSRALLTPVIFPLSETPVQINSIWKYELQNKYNENGKYHSRLNAECLVYDIQYEGDKQIATIIINSESSIQGNFKKKDIHLRLLGDYQISDKATHIVYYNITNGMVERIISENHIQWKIKSNAIDVSKFIKRKSTVKLITTP